MTYVLNNGNYVQIKKGTNTTACDTDISVSALQQITFLEKLLDSNLSSCFRMPEKQNKEWIIERLHYIITNKSRDT